jgi:hypothetical protein
VGDLAAGVVWDFPAGVIRDLARGVILLAPPGFENAEEILEQAPPALRDILRWDLAMPPAVAPDPASGGAGVPARIVRFERIA